MTDGLNGTDTAGEMRPEGSVRAMGSAGAIQNQTPRARVAVFPKGYLEDIVEGRMGLFEWIEIAGTLKDDGADGLEMYPGFFKETSEDYLLKVKQAAASNGLTIAMMCASPDFTHPSQAFRDGEVEKMKKLIEMTAVLGPDGGDGDGDGRRFCRVLSGQRRPEVAREDGIGWTVECISRLLPFAQDKGVHLIMENHYKDGFWTYPEFAQASDVFLEIVEQIDSPWFGINFDPSNAIVAGEDPLALLSRVKTRTLTMHASDRYLLPGYSLDDLKNYFAEGYSTGLAHGVIGEGLNDYDAIFTELKSVGFRGWVSIEDGVNGVDDLRRSVRFVRQKVEEYLID